MKANSAPKLPAIVDARVVTATRKGLPAPEVLVEATEVFRLLSNRVRLSLLHALSHAEMTVGDVARALDLSLSATSHQLASLRRMRLVASRDEGRLTYYRANDDFVGHLVHDCLAHVQAQFGHTATPHHHAHALGAPKTVVRRRKPKRPPPTDA